MKLTNKNQPPKRITATRAQAELAMLLVTAYHDRTQGPMDQTWELQHPGLPSITLSVEYHPNAGWGVDEWVATVTHADGTTGKELGEHVTGNEFPWELHKQLQELANGKTTPGQEAG